MHRNKKYILILAIIAISGYSNCFERDIVAEIRKLSEQNKEVISPNPLELHGDSVKFNLSLALPKEIFRGHKKTWYATEIFYTTDDAKKMRYGYKPKTKEIKAGEIFFDGYPYVMKGGQPILDKDMQFAYVDSLKFGYLVFYGIAGKGSRSKRYGPRPLMRDEGYVVGIATTCRLVKTPKNEDSNEGKSAYEAMKSATSRDDGQYKKAYELLTNAPKTFTNQFNQGLAYLLEGKNYEKAKKALETATQLNPKEALTYYVLAIVAARTKNDQDLIAHLKKAIALNPDLKAKAKADVEFYKYWEQAVFLKMMD